MLFECFLALALCKPAGMLKPHVDRYTLLHAVSMAYDGATTANSFRNCQQCVEGDPASRLLLGKRPSDVRMVLAGAAVVYATSLIPNRKIRHIAQVTFSVVHIAEGSNNLRPYNNQ